MERTGWSGMEQSLLKDAFRNSSACLTTPSAPLRWLRVFFLMAQPPLLYQEGSCQPLIHSQLQSPRLEAFSQYRGADEFINVLQLLKPPAELDQPIDLRRR